MNKLIQRLDIIKNAVAMEDENLIAMQLQELEQLALNGTVQHIIELIKSQSYEDVIQLIEDYKNKNSGMVVFEDPKVQGLRLELKVLEKKLKNLTEKKKDYTIEIDDFNREYSLRLGAIIQQILSLEEKILHQRIIKEEQAFQAKKEAFNKAKEAVKSTKKQVVEIEEELDDLDELSEEYDELYEQYQDLKEDLNHQEQDLNEKRKEAKQAKEELDEDPANKEYQNAKEDSETFEKEYEEVISEEVYGLTDEQLNELKKAYKKAARLCHPDILPEEMKEQAHQIMSELNIARRVKDLEKVKEILLSLQSGELFKDASDIIQNKDLLKAKIEKIRERIASTKEEIYELENSDDFKFIHETEDQEEFFDIREAQLKEELEQLGQELKRLTTDVDIDFEIAMANKKG
jgi:chromosome segregation ATPase